LLDGSREPPPDCHDYRQREYKQPRRRREAVIRELLIFGGQGLLRGVNLADGSPLRHDYHYPVQASCRPERKIISLDLPAVNIDLALNGIACALLRHNLCRHTDVEVDLVGQCAVFNLAVLISDEYMLDCGRQLFGSDLLVKKFVFIKVLLREVCIKNEVSSNMSRARNVIRNLALSDIGDNLWL
jgi:hypothetical protein